MLGGSMWLLSIKSNIIYIIFTCVSNVCSISFMSLCKNTYNKYKYMYTYTGFPFGLVVKNLPTMQEMLLISVAWEDPWRRAWQHTPVFLPGESMGRGAWQATVHRVTQSQTLQKKINMQHAHTYTYMCVCVQSLSHV